MWPLKKSHLVKETDHGEIDEGSIAPCRLESSCKHISTVRMGWDTACMAWSNKIWFILIFQDINNPLIYNFFKKKKEQKENALQRIVIYSPKPCGAASNRRKSHMWLQSRGLPTTGLNSHYLTTDFYLFILHLFQSLIFMFFVFSFLLSIFYFLFISSFFYLFY